MIFPGILKCLQFVRYIYILIAVVVVCLGFYNAYQKMISQDVFTRREVKVAEKLRYPSVTFCYKYKHGSKRVIDNFLPRFYESAKDQGTFS